MLETVIKTRMDVVGLTQARLAEEVGCTATQMGIFLKGSGFLNKASLEKSLSVLGVNIEMYQKRFQLAQKVSGILTNKGFDNDSIISMSRDEMIHITDLTEIQCLANVDEKEFDMMVKSGIVDYEGTFPFFKATVLHLIQIGEKTTPKNVELSFSKLAIACGLIAAVPILGISGIIGMATGALLYNKSYGAKAANAWVPLIVLTKQLLTKSKMNF